MDAIHLGYNTKLYVFFTHCYMCKMQNAPRENRKTILAANSIVVFMLPDL